MKNLYLDLETKSSVDIGDCGMYRYAESPDFGVLLFGYAIDDEPAVSLDLHDGTQIPQEIRKALFDPSVIKHARNAAFEWYCLGTYFGMTDEQRKAWIPQWRDSMLHSRYCGFPGTLEKAGEAIGLPKDQQKMRIGKQLIRIFSCPNKPTKKRSSVWIRPEDEPEKWKLYQDYNRQDVETDRLIEKKLEPWQVPDWVERQWQLDLWQNTRGVSVDMDMVKGAIDIADKVATNLTEELVQLTGLDNPNSVSQLKPWLESRIGVEIPTINKEAVEMLLKGNLDTVTKRVLRIRQEIGTSAVKKYQALVNMTSDSGQAKGMMVFYGANRSGRYSSRGCQFQNLKRTYVEPLGYAREVVKSKDDLTMRLVWGNVTDSLGQMVRTALCVPEGHIMLDADYSAIEARVIAWVSGEQWRLDIFRNGGDIYCESASRIYGVPVKKHGVNGHLRQRGKVAELAL